MSELQSQQDALDDTMLDVLYDEVPGADRAGSEAAMSAVFEKRERLESMRQLRGVLRETAAATDVEPVMSGMDALMAAARAQVADKVAHRAVQARAVAATERQPDELGFFAGMIRWFKHPAMATMALAAVVGVVFSIARLRGRSEAVQLTAPASAPAAPVATPPASAPEEKPAAKSDGDQAVVIGSLENSDKPASLPKPKSETVANEKSPAHVIDREQVANIPTKFVAKKADSAPALATKSARPSAGGLGNQEQQSATATTSYQASLDDTVGNRAGPAAGAAAQPAPITPQGSAAPTSTADATRASAPSATVEQLTAQARAAAKSGTCATVTSIAARVRALNPSYYQRSFIVDADIARCLAAGRN